MGIHHGHADYTAFKQLFDITKPEIVIPIHTEDKYKITEYTDKAVILNDMETLEINSKGNYKIIMNEDIINKEVENMQNNIITSEHVLNRLKDVKLEDYTRDDLLERYIVYGTEQELQSPTIQRALINNDLHIDLLDMVDIITDKQAIQDLLNSNIFKDKNILTMEGNISAIQFACESESNFKKDNDMICHTIVNFKDTDGNKHRLYGHTFNNLQDMGNHRESLEPYYNNIVLVVESSDNKLYAIGFLERHEDINYKVN